MQKKKDFKIFSYCKRALRVLKSNFSQIAQFFSSTVTDTTTKTLFCFLTTLYYSWITILLSDAVAAISSYSRQDRKVWWNGRIFVRILSPLGIRCPTAYSIRRLFHFNQNMGLFIVVLKRCNEIMISFYFSFSLSTHFQ